jgi:hypothetical protein
MKDAKGHGSDPRGAAASGVQSAVPKLADADMFKVWGTPPVLTPISTPIQRQNMKMLQQSDQFGQALARLPQYEGTVYRGTNLQSLKGGTAIGTEMTFPKHTSASADRATAENFSTLKGVTGSGRGTPVLMQIDNSRTADFSKSGHSSMNDWEHETIIPKGTKVRITSVEPHEFPNGKKGYHIKATQV